MSILGLLVIFVLLSAVLLLCFWGGMHFLERSKNKKIRERLGTVEAGEGSLTSVRILNEDRPASLASRLCFWATSQVEAAGLKWSLSRLLLICSACACVGIIAGLRISRALPIAAHGFTTLFPICFGALPFFYLSRKKQKRLAKIESQFPDALDFLARSLRVGNSFLMSLEMLVDESEEPLRAEFLRLTGEIRLGAPISEPMQKLIQRVPLLDIRMFVSAVLLQRDTGGNLGVLLTRIASSIRDRFRVRGQVDAASSQAKLSARVLSTMPFVVLGGILFLSPGYFKVMTDEVLGRKLLIAAAVGQLAGFLVMRKIVRIKV